MTQIVQHNRKPHRWGISLVEVLVVMMILGTLSALLLPAVNAAREGARQTTCLVNLRQIGNALGKYEATHRRFPAGRDGANGHQHSWATKVLPHLDEVPLYEAYDFGLAWNALGASHSPADDRFAGNLGIAEKDLSLFSCPTTHNAWQGATDYGGVYGSTLTGLSPGFEKGDGWDSGILVPIGLKGLKDGRRTSIRSAQVQDGLSSTLLVAEDAGRWPIDGGKWANGHQCFGQDRPAINSERSNEIFSDHPNGANVLFGDASARMLPTATDALVVGRLCIRNDSRH